MTNDTDCIFCKIAAKEIPSEIVRETEDFVVIKDASPQAPVHLLVIPKAHYANFIECSDSGLLGDMVAIAGKAAREAGVVESGFRLVVNTNEEGGQTVFHLHMHILGGRVLSGKMG